MADQFGNAVPTPGFTQGATVSDSEILYSTAGYTQKGVTLLGGKGILPAGTVLGRVTGSKKWTVYDNGKSDGTEVARGVLRQTTDTTNGDVQANIVIRGILKNSMVSGADSAALTDLGARTDTVLGTFTF